MAKNAPKVHVFSVGSKEGAKSLLTVSAPSSFKKERIADDAQKLDDILSNLRDANPCRHDDWTGIWDHLIGLSWIIRRYGLDASVSVNIELAAATEADHWETEKFYREEEAEKRKKLTKAQTSKRAA